MKNMLCFLAGLVFFAANISAQTTEKIEGAFGFKLGDFFDPSTAINSEQMKGKYKVTPKIIYPGLTSYYVTITPTTKVIHTITAAATFASKEAGKQIYEDLVNLIEAKYNQKMEGHGSETLLYKTLNKGLSSIGMMLLMDGNVAIQLGYSDMGLLEQGAEEQRKIEAQKAGKLGL